MLGTSISGTKDKGDQFVWKSYDWMNVGIDGDICAASRQQYREYRITGCEGAAPSQQGLCSKWFPSVFPTPITFPFPT